MPEPFTNTSPTCTVSILEQLERAASVLGQRFTSPPPRAWSRIRVRLWFRPDCGGKHALRNGTLVPPGLYVARIHLQTASGDQTLHRVVHIIY